MIINYRNGCYLTKNGSDIVISEGVITIAGQEVKLRRKIKLDYTFVDNTTYYVYMNNKLQYVVSDTITPEYDNNNFYYKYKQYRYLGKIIIENGEYYFDNNDLNKPNIFYWS